MSPRASLTLMLGLAVGLGGSAPALAQDDRARVVAEAVSVEVGAAVADPWRVATDPLQTARLRALALHGPGPIRLRWGLDLRAGPNDVVHPFVGVGLAAGRHTTLFYEQGPPEAAPEWPPQLARDSEARMGMELRTRSPRATWREFGTLRMQVGLHGRVSLKPRRGGVKLTWQTRF